MSKKRRTRKEKMTASTRHAFQHVLVEPKADGNTFRISQEIKEDAEISKPSATPHRSYSYVVSDIRNSLLIISILIALNITVFTILKLKLISLFGIVF